MKAAMKAISLNMPENLLELSGELAGHLGLSRADYIRKALERMNQIARAELRAKRIAEASRRCRAESMRVNAEFAAFERDPGA